MLLAHAGAGFSTIAVKIDGGYGGESDEDRSRSAEIIGFLNSCFPTCISRDVIIDGEI